MTAQNDYRARIHRLSDTEVFALTVWGEARGESAEGQEAVAWVILNRARARGQTVREVCLAPKQFSCWNATDTNLPQMLNPSTLKRPEYLFAEGLCLSIQSGIVPKLGVSFSADDPTHGADHYFNPSVVMPSWAAKMEKTATIGRHVFYRSKPLGKTRTMTGAKVAAGATAAGAAAQAASDPSVIETVTQTAPYLAPVLQQALAYGPWVLAALALAGIGWIVWARIDDHQNGVR